MTRLEFSRKVRREALLRAAGNCEECGFPLRPGRFQFHHVVEANDGGKATLENCKVVCTACHAPLTAAYLRELRKAERIRDKHSGAIPPSRHPLPFGRSSGYKRTMSGKVIRRTP